MKISYFVCVRYRPHGEVEICRLEYVGHKTDPNDGPCSFQWIIIKPFYQRTEVFKLGMTKLQKIKEDASVRFQK